MVRSIPLRSVTLSEALSLQWLSHMHHSFHPKGGTAVPTRMTSVLLVAVIDVGSAVKALRGGEPVRVHRGPVHSASKMSIMPRPSRKCSSCWGITSIARGASDLLALRRSSLWQKQAEVSSRERPHSLGSNLKITFGVWRGIFI